MEDAPRRPEDTREFVAMWQAVTDEHLAHKLATILEELMRRDPSTRAIGAEQCAVLAPHVLRALQVASSPGGGVHAAVQYLAGLVGGGGKGAGA